MSQSSSSSSGDHDAMDEDIDDLVEVYTMEDFMAEQQILDVLTQHIGEKLKVMLEQSVDSFHRRSGPRRFIPRNHAEGHNRLVANYFSENPLYTEQMFRRRFRMRKPLFLRIVSALGDWSSYFTNRVDATNGEGLSPLQKCTTAIRMLAYGTSADQLDEVLSIGASTSLECLSYFAKGVIAKFGEEYFRPPSVDELEHLLQIGESRGFPGMIESIDCMHWQWENCSVAWRGQFTHGDHGVPTMILEAVASHDLRIWHAYFGVAGSNNDINVQNRSTFTLKGETPKVQFNVNGRQYNSSYYLADGVYPEWAIFVKTIPLPQSEKDKLFAKRQEGARKDVKRAFGALQACFNIVRRPARLWKPKAIEDIMRACVRLPNTIVEDERETFHVPLDLNNDAGSSFALPPEVIVGPHVAFTDYLQRSSAIQDRQTHLQLKDDLVNNIWQCFDSE
ncbi:hypothetical protein ZWY2020_015819 [Hordeum vulgare]|nr:hypothetical protein ZWY2020_015819 [Hordeum vulgare]